MTCAKGNISPMAGVHYVCMHVQRFEPQGRRFTNFHLYYYYYHHHHHYYYIIIPVSLLTHSLVDMVGPPKANTSLLRPVASAKMDTWVSGCPACSFQSCRLPLITSTFTLSHFSRVVFL